MGHMLSIITVQAAHSWLRILQIYAAPLQGGSRAVVMFNRHQQLDPLFNVQNLTVYWPSIGIAPNTTVRICHSIGSLSRIYA